MIKIKKYLNFTLALLLCVGFLYGSKMPLKADEEIIYTIVFDADGGSVVDSQFIKEGEKAIQPDNPTKEGYSFIGWYLEEELFDFNETITSDLTLVAKWEEEDISNTENSHIDSTIDKETTDDIDTLSFEKEEVVLSIKAPLKDTRNGSGELFVSNSGDDVNGDGSEGNPFASLSKAYQASSEGSTIILLSDIEAHSFVSVWHSVTIKSKDGQGPYTVRRATGFAPSADAARKSYHPAMFELHNDNGPVMLRFENIIIDDYKRTEGSVYAWPNTGGGNENRVQDAIIAIYNLPSVQHEAKLVLGKDATVKDYGGMCAVRVTGTYSTFIMETGSKISHSGPLSEGATAVLNNGATFIMEEGSMIDGASGSKEYGSAVHTDMGNTIINGSISNCYGIGYNSTLWFRGGNHEIGEKAIISDNTSRIGALYVMDYATVTIRGEISNNRTISGTVTPQNVRSATPVGSALYVVRQAGATPTVYIEDGAKITGNESYLHVSIGYGIEFDLASPFGTAVLANNESNIYMNGGTITNNKTPFGVMTRKNGYFEMNGGDISSHDYGIVLFNEGNEIRTAKAIINEGSVNNNTKALSIFESNYGYHEGSYAYLSKDILNQNVRIAFTERDFITLRDNKTIMPDPAMEELYLGNASTSGKTRINEVVSRENGTLLATFFASTPSDLFKMDVGGLTATDQNVYVCLIPVQSDGSALAGDIVSLCDKTISGSTMTANVNTTGLSNPTGYAIGIFRSNLLTIKYDLNGGQYNGSSSPIIERYNKDTLIKIHEAPTRDGYKFLYWEGSEYYPGDDYTVIDHHTFVAKWKPNPKPKVIQVPVPNTGVNESK